MITVRFTREERTKGTMDFAVFHDDPGDPTKVGEFPSRPSAAKAAKDLNDRTKGGYVVARKVGFEWVWGAGADAQHGRGAYGDCLRVSLPQAAS